MEGPTGTPRTRDQRARSPEDGPPTWGASLPWRPLSSWLADRAVTGQGYQPWSLGQGRSKQGYDLPPVPESAWTAAPSRRRAWISRGILFGVLVLQATLSLRLRNTAFEDEALYLYAGHLELDQLLGGPAAPEQFAAYFSGAPALYPVLAAAVDSIFGLTGARLLSLAFMLAATALLCSLTRLLFNERVALCAAAAFAITQSTLFLGNFATYDAPAICLLTLASWIVVRTAHLRGWVACVAGAPVLGLAVAVKYAALMYVPTVTILAVMAALPRRGPWALTRGLALPAVTGAVIAGALRVAGGDHLLALRTTTTQRAAGTADPRELLLDCLEWGGPMFAVAVLGTVLYVRQGRMGEVPGMNDAAVPGRIWRLCLGGVLCGTALLAPAYQVYLHTGVSLHKHIGYGLLFAAPMAGIGMNRLVGAHFRNPQLGILVWVTLLVLGMTQSQALYQAWADSDRIVAALRPEVRPGGRYLVEANSVARYYLREKTRPEQWTSTYAIAYTNREGERLSGEAGFRAAIADGYFDVIVLDRTVTKALDDRLYELLRKSPKYRLRTTVPFRNSNGTGTYRIWVKGATGDRP
ncbi:phospholipid carrier-dependent glycosyltransferase [Sphaerisporangium album]|uniref:Phospholipid carrier-dependent glycosyltransferase n=1 Tax=Sphaerisporangium album TaxID=509200 RepID=A0A367FPP4_9ACTN|nr:glycosyltransferase family 39 protein [Sphaerisporangium album]RCG31677.1 phospholipid carrier-dependent glycosyltransferase [Sphaerisporangium album]